jgi:hypothetical protein
MDVPLSSSNASTILFKPNLTPTTSGGSYYPCAPTQPGITINLHTIYSMLQLIFYNLHFTALCLLTVYCQCNATHTNIIGILRACRASTLYHRLKPMAVHIVLNLIATCPELKA